MINWQYYIFCTVLRGGLVGNERNVAEDELISTSIDESSTKYDSDDGSTSTNALE